MHQVYSQGQLIGMIDGDVATSKVPESVREPGIHVVGDQIYTVVKLARPIGAPGCFKCGDESAGPNTGMCEKCHKAYMDHIHRFDNVEPGKGYIAPHANEKEIKPLPSEEHAQKGRRRVRKSEPMAG